jgi:hypothetical protein
MGHFPQTIATALAGKVVRQALLVKFDFRSAPMRLWSGHGALATQDGLIWNGLGELGQIDGLEQAMNGTAPLTTFTLSGVSPEIVAMAKGEKSEFAQRLAVVYLQFFDEDWQTLDLPHPVNFCVMDTPEFDRPLVNDPLASQTRTITITAESLFARGARPPYGSYSDRDQQARFPGDRFCERLAELQNKTVIWPPT